jgi:hypothetical protein
MSKFEHPVANGGKDHVKHNGKRPKLTFGELLVKYQKDNEAKRANGSMLMARVTAALNTDLEGATTEMDRYHEELRAAQARIAYLEAQLAGQRPPQEEMPYQTTATPPCKRLCYGTAEATTRLG